MMMHVDTHNLQFEITTMQLETSLNGIAGSNSPETNLGFGVYIR
jgi:hypothetical protein